MKRLVLLVCTAALSICLFIALWDTPAMAQATLPPFRLQADTTVAVTIVLTDGQTILVPINLSFVTRNEPEGMYITLDATTKPQDGVVVVVAPSNLITASARVLPIVTPLPVTTSAPNDTSSIIEPTATSLPTPVPPTTMPAPTATTIPTALPPSGASDNPGINTDVVVGDIKWRVLAVDDLGNRLTSDNMFVDDAVTSGRFVRVRVEIENRGTSGAAYWGPSIVDDHGRTYNDYTGQSFFIDDASSCMLLTINAGLSKQCVHIYEIASDSHGLKLKVSDFALFFAKEALIDLH